LVWCSRLERWLCHCGESTLIVYGPN
jgi:hypothetical protein